MEGVVLSTKDGKSGFPKICGMSIPIKPSLKNGMSFINSGNAVTVIRGCHGKMNVETR